MMERQTLIHAANWMQEIQGMLAAHKQARWQLNKCAGEHKALWQAMVDLMDNRIKLKEAQIAQALAVPGFRAKREV